MIVGELSHASTLRHKYGPRVSHVGCEEGAPIQQHRGQRRSREAHIVVLLQVNLHIIHRIFERVRNAFFLKFFGDVFGQYLPDCLWTFITFFTMAVANPKKVVVGNDVGGQHEHILVHLIRLIRPVTLFGAVREGGNSVFKLAESNSLIWRCALLLWGLLMILDRVPLHTVVLLTVVLDLLDDDRRHNLWLRAIHGLEWVEFHFFHGSLFSNAQQSASSIWRWNIHYRLIFMTVYWLDRSPLILVSLPINALADYIHVILPIWDNVGLVLGQPLWDHLDGRLRIFGATYWRHPFLRIIKFWNLITLGVLVLAPVSRGHCVIPVVVIKNLDNLGEVESLLSRRCVTFCVPHGVHIMLVINQDSGVDSIEHLNL